MIEPFAERLIELAYHQNISDIHLLPKEKMYHVYFRYNGELIQIARWSHEIGNRLIRYFKYTAKMAIGEKRKPQTGACRLFIRQKLVEIRLSTMSNYLQQETMVMRLLYQTNVANESDIPHYFPKDVNKLYQLLNKKQGLVIFSGPVDSGKTTTIYRLLLKKYIEKPIQIMSMEDPVEIKDSRFLQTEIQEEIGVDYDTLIKASLRHHPDILLIGEIRDVNTAKMAIRAALTGHLVIATLHAKSCIGIIERLEDLTISKSMLKETLTGLVSQRLLPRFCALCQNSCQFYCQHIPVEVKRLALTHILSGEQLKRYWNNEKVSTFNQVLNKALICGYIHPSVWEAYTIENE